MFAFVVDRFLSVFCTLFYRKHSSKIMILLCAFTWVFAIVVRGIGFPRISDCYVSSGCLPTLAFISPVVQQLVLRQRESALESSLDLPQ